MTITITQIEVISALVGVVIGYKGRNLISSWIANVKKAISGVVTPKP